MVTRAIPMYVDFASFVVNELKQIGDRGHAQADRDRAVAPAGHAQGVPGGANLTGLGADDPDANFFENFACGSPRNYTGYCNEQVDEA